MTLGNKLAKLRREQNLTQEQLAELMGVSRQAVSKWESGLAIPETEKLIRLGALFHCSMDELLTDRSESASVPAGASFAFYEKKSSKTVFGLPLWHVNIGYGRTARGVIAVGMKSRGVISIGLLSMGLVSFGVLSLGLVSIGVLALGLAAAGSIACALFALGAISVGIVSVGAMAIGDFSLGALAVGTYFAMGDSAIGAIAFGRSHATGSLLQVKGFWSAAELAEAKRVLSSLTPPLLVWAEKLFAFFL